MSSVALAASLLFAPAPTRGEVPWLLEDDDGNVHDVIVRGDVRGDTVTGFECVDAVTGASVAMRDDDRERAKRDLVDASVEIWRTR